MDEAVFWVGFVGAWFLFAGPIYQSALELREEEDARLSMQTAIDTVGPALSVSPWWWLLPPVAIVLIFRSRAAFMRIIDAQMTDDDRQAVGHYQSVARGWWFVGLGAWCIFLKETWELVEHHEWSSTAYWVVVVAMTLLALGSGGAGGDRSARERNQQRRGRALTTSPDGAPRPAGSG